MKSPHKTKKQNKKETETEKKKKKVHTVCTNPHTGSTPGVVYIPVDSCNGNHLQHSDNQTDTCDHVHTHLYLRERETAESITESITALLSIIHASHIV